jgi:hypothetical protein
LLLLQHCGKETIVRWHSFSAASTVLVAMGWLLGPQAAPADAKIVFVPKRFHFKIDPKTPLNELLPVAPEVAAPTPPWLVEQLAQVPEVLFQKSPPIAKAEPAVKKSEKQADEELTKAMEQTALVIARINHLNEKGADHFLKVLRERRRDLDGLPFVMGDACRMSKSASKAFLFGVTLVAEAAFQEELQDGSSKTPADPGVQAERFWDQYVKMHRDLRKIQPVEKDREREETRVRIAALMQMLAPESAPMRQKLVAHLADIKDAEATRALARLAVFSPDPEVRRPALAALKSRPKDQYADVVLAGLRYPWPAVIQNAADAAVQLGHKELVPQLVALLDEADPRAPAERDVGGKKTLAVREVAKLNHHRNCLLCHPPGNTPDVRLGKLGDSDEVAVGPVPSPGQPMSPRSLGGYDRFSSPDILVRADITYLRQDFSLLQPVKDAAPWPDRQRFDFLVRTRPVSVAEAAAYEKWLRQQGTDYMPPHHRTALAALRALTGQDASAPTAAAWRALLGL